MKDAMAPVEIARPFRGWRLGRQVALDRLLLIVALAAGGAHPCVAQPRSVTLEQLRQELAPGDVVTVVPAVGAPVAGRLTRLGVGNLELLLVEGHGPSDRDRRDVTFPLGALRSIERPRDPARNGAFLGAVIGAATGGALFLGALIVDRNGIDEWAAPYAGVAAACTVVGGLVGWSLDAARSKPHLRYEASSGQETTVVVRPLFAQGPGIAIAVSFAR